jgi:hypothetical protein
MMSDEPIYIIDYLSDTEILELCGLLPVGDKVRKIIEEENKEEGSLDILRDEAYVGYWRRKLSEVPILDEEAVATLLKLPENASARKILGDAAMLDKLSSQDIETILAHVTPCEWIHRQVLARHTLNRFSEKRSNVGDEGTIFEETICLLIDLKTAWAILDIVPLLTHDELTTLFGRMQNKSILNRPARHEIREAIQVILRAEKGRKKGHH